MNPLTPLLVWATYNVGHARNRRVFRDIVRILRTESPVALGLNEIGDRAGVLARFAARVRRRTAATPLDRVKALAAVTGYVLVHDLDPSQPRSNKIAALIRPDVKIDHARLVKLSDFTKVGRRTAGCRRTGIAPPKYLLDIGLTVEKEERVIGVVHLVPSASKRGNTRTRALYAVQIGAVAVWMRTRKRVAIVLGDLNAALNRARERRLLKPLLDVADLFAKASHGLRAIDIFATRGADPEPGEKRKRVLGVVEVLDGYTSDHKPAVFTERQHAA